MFLNFELKNYDLNTVYVLNTTKEEIYHIYNFKIQDPNSRSKFYRYSPSNFINPKKKTDMCPICYAQTKLRNHCNSL